MNGTFVVFVFVFLDCCVVTMVVFFPFVLKFTVKCLYVQVLWNLGTVFLLPLRFWPSKEKHYVSSYTAND